MFKEHNCSPIGVPIFLQGGQRLFSGCDLSRPHALEAHLRWGFQPVSPDVWAAAGLALYTKGDVLYMLMSLSESEAT